MTQIKRQAGEGGEGEKGRGRRFLLQAMGQECEHYAGERCPKSGDVIYFVHGTQVFCQNSL